MKWNAFLFVLIFMIGSADSFAEVTLPAMYKENAAYQKVARQYRFDHSILISANPLGDKSSGFGYRLGFSLGMTSFDLGIEYLKSAWGNLSSEISADDAANALSGGALDQPESELRRVRTSSDPWSLWIYELGFSVRGRLYPFAQKTWIQYARFSVGHTRLTDQVNELSFKGWLFGVEGGLSYLLAENVTLSPFLVYRFGFANRADLQALDDNRLPLNNLQLGLGLTYLIF